jgi:hypothetical protein
MWRALLQQPLVVAARALAPARVGVVAGLFREHRLLLVIKQHLALLIRAIPIHAT